jgi:tetratricopeptide (TPR) repeat protein
MKSNKILAFAFLFSAFLFGAAQIAFAQDKQNDLKFSAELEKDFQAGTAGDQIALVRALQTADKILAVNPKDAETLVWRGAGWLAQAGKAFQSGNFAEGGELWQKALENMKSAVEHEPRNVSIRMIRGAALLSAAKQFPSPDVARNLRETAAVDYEQVLTVTAEKFKTMPEKQQQQILYSLADAYDKLGDKIKTRVFYQRFVDETSEAGKMRETAIEWLKKNN